MNTKELILAGETMLAAANIGKVSYKGKKSEEWNTQEAQYCKFNWGINDYRVGAHFPELPPGMAWHNPRELTPEQFETNDGWRPLMRHEVDEQRHTDIEWSDSELLRWLPRDCRVFGTNRTRAERGWVASGDCLRTQRPMPNVELPPEPREEVQPTGRVVHNPQGLDNAGPGYRFLYMDELDQTPEDTEFFYTGTRGEPYWTESMRRGGALTQGDRSVSTYRTRAQ